MDSNNYIARTEVKITNRKIESKARELLEILIKILFSYFE